MGALARWATYCFIGVVVLPGIIAYLCVGWFLWRDGVVWQFGVDDE